MPSSAPNPAASRDMRLDSLRGLMLVGMALNHITCPLHLFTDHPLGYTSAAEGFVFLSGLVAGLVYSRRRERVGRAAMTRSARARACTIYFCHVGLFVGLLIWTNVFADIAGTTPGNSPPAMWREPWASLLTGLTFINQPPLLDILPIYVGFMLLLPGILLALDRGHRHAILAASFALWVATNLYYPDIPYYSGVIQIGAFYLGAWQLLFVIGAIFGQAWAAGKPLLSRSPSPWLLATAIAVCTYCFLVRHWYIHAPFASFAAWVNKNNLAPARLINTLALFYLVHAVFVRWPRVVTWPPLALLGRHSLVIFCVHVAAAYVLYAFPQYVSSTVAQSWLGTGLMIGVLYLVALIREQARTSVRVPPVREAVGFRP